MDYTQDIAHVIHKYEDDRRGRGRTMRQLLQMPKGGLFLVHSKSQEENCRKMYEDELGKELPFEIKVIQDGSDLQKIRLSVRRRRVDLDHYLQYRLLMQALNDIDLTRVLCMSSSYEVHHILKA